MPDFFAYLNTRKNKLDGVVITGGEPTLQKDLHTFIQKIKDLDFCVKLDTNGTNPNVIKQLLDLKLLDYIAMDIKAPLLKYKKIIDTDVDISEIQNSLDLIMSCGLDYEFRTTVTEALLTVDDFDEIGATVEGAKKYFLQNFVYSKILDETFKDAKPFSQADLERIVKILLNHGIEQVHIR